MTQSTKLPKILYYDLETAPNLSFVWGHYEQNVIEHDREWYILCFSYMWEGDKHAKVHSLDQMPEYSKDREDDKQLLGSLWEMMDRADVTIAHNGDKFDMKKSNARFLHNGMGPPSPTKQIDTLKMARSAFAFNSNKLGDLANRLGHGVKEATGGFSTWKGCMAGDPKAWTKMRKYAKQDTALLPLIYHDLKPWMKNHPSFNLMTGQASSCPTCCASEENITKRGFMFTKTGTYQRYYCKACNSYPRSRTALPDAIKPKYVS
jgi:hypothetical protein